MNWLFKHRPSPGTAFGLAALVIALGGVALAAIPDSDGTIHACYQKRGGDLRVVDSEDQCRDRRERPISWSKAGPPGTNVVARLRGGPVTPTQPGGTPIPVSPASWSQGPNEFQQLNIEMRQTVVSCEIRVRFALDGHEVVTFVASPQDRPGTYVFPIFEPGSQTTHTLTADITSNTCATPGHTATVDSVKADVLGFS
jgi:hypothetical protein